MNNTSHHEILRDPREYRIIDMFSRFRTIYSIVSPKGGVGKTTIASLLALALRDLGGVGLLDMDFFGPSCHIVLGAENIEFTEKQGIIPPNVAGIYFASIEPFIGDNYLSLRGHQLRNAILEFLSILNWPKLDFLVVDMPPGMGDTLLESLRLFPTAEYIVITTPSKLAYKTTRRLIRYLKDNNYSVRGIIENMTPEKPTLRSFAQQEGIEYLGFVPYDPSLEQRLGNIDLLKSSPIFDALKGIAKKLVANNLR